MSKRKSSDNNLIDQAVREWKTKKRRMGCVSATDFLCKRVPGFKPLRVCRWTKDGEFFQHVVATDGKIVIDLAPYTDDK